MKRFKFGFLNFFLLCLFVFVNTAYSEEEKLKPYPMEVEELIFNFKNGNVNTAIDIADALVKKTSDSDKFIQNKHIALLERGKIALVGGKYDQVITDLQEAEKRFLMTEGTISLTEGLGSILTDDIGQEYEPEMHEKLMISPYLVMAYLKKGDFDGARVERNKTITKINQYIEEKPNERAYLENPFARLMSAIVYEMDAKYDDAKIEYEKMKLDSEISRLDNNKGKTTDILMVIETGLGPQKYEEKWGPTKIGAVSLGFAYAGYKPTPTEVTQINTTINDKPIGTTNLLYDIEKTILTQYDNNKAVLMTKIVARMTAKATVQGGAQVAADKVADRIPLVGFLFRKAVEVASQQWIAVEQADLRGWLTLPKQIHYVRVSGLEPGEHNIKMDYGCGSQMQKIIVEKDKINIAFFSFPK